MILWSDNHTGFHGSISAQGGKNGGDGGFVETSSKGSLSVNGLVGLFAPLGNHGSWLLDPDNINISSGGTDPAAGQTFATTGLQTINPASITAALQAGNLTLQANTDIQILSSIDNTAIVGATPFTSSPGSTLTMQAGRSIVGTSGIDISGPIVLVANDSGATPSGRSPGQGNITFSAQLS